MQIELLYFDGCPSWQAGLDNLKAALEAEEMVAYILLIKIADDDDAARLKFLGSPSFCINGMDWWPEEREQYNLSCRAYLTPQGMKGVPTVDMLRKKLRTPNLK